MRHLTTKSVTVALIWFLFFSILQQPAPGMAVSSSVLPENISVSDRFEPGYGPSVGAMVIVEGRVFIVHENIKAAYPASKDQPLYKGDTIYTEQNSRARFKLNDGSIMTLSSSTTLAISKSIYDPDKKRRSSFLSLIIGKARFYVFRLFTSRETAFNVKAGTFVAGVRGSDFVIEKTLVKTEIITLDNTSLEILDMKEPDNVPTLLSSFQRTGAEKDGKLTKPVGLTPQEIENIRKEFFMPGDAEGKPSMDKTKAKLLKPEKPETEPLAGLKTEEILIPEENLEKPEPADRPEHEPVSDLQDLRREEVDIAEILSEDVAGLPGMPGPPQAETDE